MRSPRLDTALFLIVGLSLAGGCNGTLLGADESADATLPSSDDAGSDVVVDAPPLEGEDAPPSEAPDAGVEARPDARVEEPPDASSGPVDSGMTPTGPWFATPVASARIFATGHSLLDRIYGLPMRDGGPMATLARAAGRDHGSLLQDGAGSTARLRRLHIVERGVYPRPDWASFDTVVVAERHDLPLAVRYEGTIDEVGWFVDQVRGAPPGGDRAFFYHTWWYHDGDQAPRLRTWADWSAHTRRELRLYECVAERVGALRGFRMPVIPGGLALAALIDEIEAGTMPLRASAIFEDDVHLTDLGDAFLAAVHLASVYHTPSRGLAMPGASADVSERLTALADRVVGDYHAGYSAPSPAQCRTLMSELCTVYAGRCPASELGPFFPDGSF
jgi:hypothetical protein